MKTMHDIDVEADLLASNNAVAQHNRDHFAESRTYVINVMSSPGAGKTSLLERTIEALKTKLKIGVIEGDLQTDLDAQRIGKYEVPVVQINTGGACHLDARLIIVSSIDSTQKDWTS
jgi:hydrogenase nickel incorporation protein HypB